MRASEKNVDYLTGMINRRGLYEIWEALPEGACVHCLYMDIDNFKLVNDVYGHAKGDELLIFVSTLLQEMFPGQLVQYRFCQQSERFGKFIRHSGAGRRGHVLC